MNSTCFQRETSRPIVVSFCGLEHAIDGPLPEDAQNEHTSETIVSGISVVLCTRARFLCLEHKYSVQLMDPRGSICIFHPPTPPPSSVTRTTLPQVSGVLRPSPTAEPIPSLQRTPSRSSAQHPPPSSNAARLAIGGVQFGGTVIGSRPPLQGGKIGASNDRARVANFPPAY